MSITDAKLDAETLARYRWPDGIGSYRQDELGDKHRTVWSLMVDEIDALRDENERLHAKLAVAQGERDAAREALAVLVAAIREEKP